MVPLRLRVRNFMCYREPPEPLVFEGVHIACLTGNNGHGKSALLDAMTWALWGEARAKSDDELVHIGQTEMEVELTFRVDTAVYRVVRKRALPRSLRSAGTTTLELQAVTGEGGTASLTGGTVRETQRAINRLVRMDYETFINSAFLLQGKADLFTMKTAAQRKEVLSEILGLGLYDRLEARARELHRAADDRVVRLQSELDQLDRELEQREDVARDLAQARRDAAALAQQHQALQQTVAVLAERRQVFDLYAQQREEIQRRIATHQTSLALHRAEIDRQQDLIAGYTAVVARRDDILAGMAELEHTEALVAAETERLAQVRGLERRRDELQRRIEEDRAALATEVRLLEAEISQHRPRAAHIAELEDELAGLDYEEVHLEQLRADLENRRQRVAEWDGRKVFLREENRHLRQQMDEIKARQAQIVALDDDAVCPLCQTPLGRDGRDHIAAEYQRQGEELRDRYRANETEAKTLDAKLKAAQTEVANLTNVLDRTQRQIAEKQARLNKELADARHARDQLVLKEPRLAERRRLLEQGEYAQDEQAALAQVHAELACLAFDQGALAAAQQRQQELRHYRDLASKLHAAEQGLVTAQEALTRAEQLVEQTQAALAEETERLEGVLRGLEGADEVRGQLALAERQLRELADQLAAQQQKLGGLEEKANRLDQLAALRVDKAADLADERRARDAYSDLATAFGKRGIQALVIEQALPQLEEMANDLLGRMTSNRMTVKLEATRETQRGAQVETLDIKIADELGTRAYELYSGGEAFRINFALRVALSKLLAHRAGAPLPTLILDEGFGSQDAAGREKLVEVLNAIQDDFECILVITHIEELKDVFPVRIEVMKTAAGSSYRMTV